MPDPWPKSLLKPSADLDSFRCHISDQTKEELRRLKIDSAVIPGGCTKFIQAPDVCWNGPFKARIREYYDEWLKSGGQELTAAGNPHPPSLEVCCSWIRDAWKSLDKKLIAHSFKVCVVFVA